MKPKIKLFLFLLWRDVRESLNVFTMALMGLCLGAACIGASYKLCLWVGEDAESATEAMITGVSFLVLLCAFIAWLVVRWQQCHVPNGKVS
jgi:hypothetical protein